MFLIFKQNYFEGTQVDFVRPRRVSLPSLPRFLPVLHSQQAGGVPERVHVRPGGLQQVGEGGRLRCEGADGGLQRQEHEPEVEPQSGRPAEARQDRAVSGHGGGEAGPGGGREGV